MSWTLWIALAVAWAEPPPVEPDADGAELPAAPVAEEASEEASSAGAGPEALPAPPGEAELPLARPVDEVEEVEPPASVSREVYVYGERAIPAARDEVIRAAKEEGYTRQVRKKDRTILRHELPYKGEVVLHDDGRAEVKRQPVRFEPPFAKNKSPAAYLMCVLVPFCIRTGGQTVSPRRFRSYERTALAAIQPDAMEWNERISDHALVVKLDQLPDRLYALWEEGTPVDPGETLSTHEQRRRAIFQFWDERTETEWGQAVRESVMSFVRAEVQSSEHPFTPEEIARFNGTRRSTLPFDPSRRRTAAE